MKADPHSLDNAVQQLKRDWNQLSPIDRACAVARIRRSRRSIRSIARDLNRSESSLRHLLDGLKAPAADLAAARHGEITFNELVRRAKAAAQKRALQAQQAARQDQERQADQAAKLICDWLRKQNIGGPDGETIINLVRDKFKQARSSGIPLPKVAAPAGRSAAELIKLCRPKRPIPDNAENNNWYVDWLLWWVMYVVRDSDVRDQALDIALEQQWKR